jgi:xanthine phosphoribosyltransferase
MDLLQERIVRDGRVMAGDVLKVDSFLNHQMDIELFFEIGKEFYRLFQNCGVNKILTIEASGIGIACVTAQFFHVPVVFAKKNPTKNIEGEVHTSRVESFTHGRTYDIIVSKRFLGFLAKGSALLGLIDLVRKAGASLAGAGIVIEKGFQEGGALVRAQGVHLESLAIVDSMSEAKGVIFRRDA